MQIVAKIEDVKKAIAIAETKDKTIGFVPTMGYLHEGHMSLIKAAREAADFVVVSIFVNPIQFAPNEDLAVYPRDFERDCRLIEAEGGDLVFHPEPSEMYPADFVTQVKVDRLGEHLCGQSRPHHFAGVTTVVNKLFNLVRPQFAFFGEKDAQQLYIVRQMVKDLCLPVTVVGCPIVREEDGLAKSSRNVYLSAKERAEAVVLRQSLLVAKKEIDAGERDAKKIMDAMRAMVEKTSGRVDYIEVVSLPVMEPVAQIAGENLIAMAVRFGQTRLIDNIMIKV